MRLINAEPYEDCRIVLHKEDEGVAVADIQSVDKEIEEKMETYYQKWGTLTPEVVMKMIRGEEA